MSRVLLRLFQKTMHTSPENIRLNKQAKICSSNKLLKRGIEELLLKIDAFMGVHGKITEAFQMKIRKHVNVCNKKKTSYVNIITNQKY